MLIKLKRFYQHSNMATPAQNVKLPVKFAVEMRFNNRVGFCLVRTDQERGTNAYDILLRENSDNHFYNIETYVPLNTPVYTQNVKKRQEHRVHWSYTMKQLKHSQTIIPVIKFTPKVHLPSICTWNFVPIIERGQTPAQAQAPAPIPPIVQSKLPIKEIPNHAIRLLLLGAVIEGEECPISGTAIDITNGSVTSCFHLFERDSIARWLALPHTNKKCPVCMQECDLYLLP
jgi:hypothetical protein